MSGVYHLATCACAYTCLGGDEYVYAVYSEGGSITQLRPFGAPNDDILAESTANILIDLGLLCYSFTLYGLQSDLGGAITQEQ